MNGVKIFLLLLTVSFSSSKFIYNNPITLPSGVIDLEYSPGQTVLAVSTNTTLNLFNGVTGVSFQNFTFAEGITFGALSFSQDDNLFAVGFSNGQFETFKRGISFSQEMEDYAEEDSPIKSLCFTADNSHLIFITQNKITVYDLSATVNNTKTLDYEGEAIYVACSPFETELFTVAGTKNETGKLTEYKYDFGT